MTIPVANSCYESGNFSIRLLLLSLLLTSLPTAGGTAYSNATFMASTDNITAATTGGYYKGPDGYFEGPDGNPYIDKPGLGPSLLSRCSSSYENAIRPFEKTVSGVNEYPKTWRYTPSPPCCMNCTVKGGTVQVFYWPTPAPTPGVTALVNSAGFTFVSPSIYVAFQSLQAKDWCGQIGTSLAETTIGFLPNELSTSRGVFYDLDYVPVSSSAYTWSSFVYKDLQSQCENYTSTFCSNVFFGTNYLSVDPTTYTDCILPSSFELSIGGIDYYTYSYNPCSPILSVPSLILTLEPEWRTCVDGIGAFYDPPYALMPASGILQVPQTTIDPPALTTPAETGQSPRPQTASVTSFATSTTRTGFTPLPVKSTEMMVSTGQQSTDPQKSTQTMVNNDNAPVPTPLAIGSQTISANSAGAVVVGSITLKAGAPPITISNLPLSLGSTILVIASSTYSIPAPVSAPSPSPLPAAPPVLTLGSDPITANAASAYIIGTQTLSPGGPAVAVSGTTYSLPSASDYILVDGATSNFQPLDPPVLTLGSDPITANSASAYVIGTETLLPGGPAITASGLTYSLPSSAISATAAYILVNGITSTLLPPTPVSTPTLDASSTALVLDPTRTSSAGEVFTYGSEVVSLATNAGGMVDGTVIVVSGGTTKTLGLGAWIADGMGIQTTGTGVPVQGECARRSPSGSWWRWTTFGILVFAIDYGW